MLKKAALWVKKNALDGRCVPVSDRQLKPYPEVTGYWIPTLLQIGEYKLAENFARFLMSVQNPDGSFSLDKPNETFVFDTGQIIRGWVSIASRLPEILEPMRKACNWIVNGADAQTGRFVAPPPGNMWSLGARGEVNEGIHLYVIQPLREAAEILNEPSIRKAADRALNLFLANPEELIQFERPNALTHFYAYIQEALFETGCHDLAQAGMRSAAKFQLSTGAVPGYFDVQWICSTGLAQLAKVWFLLGETDRARGALDFLCCLQNYTGGFYGSYGPNAGYFPSDEIAWAPKYAIDAELLGMRHHFGACLDGYPKTVDETDERAQVILSACRGARKVLDAGCGRGRYATLVKTRFPDIEVHGADLSPQLLAVVPGNIKTTEANIQNMPFPDGEFDVVYCIEALEHAPNPATVIAEMARLVRPGGQLVIIDKNAEKRGVFEARRWESWFEKEELAKIMDICGFRCTISDLAYEDKPADGLFLCWHGIKGETRQGIPLNKAAGRSA